MSRSHQVLSRKAVAVVNFFARFQIASASSVIRRVGISSGPAAVDTTVGVVPAEPEGVGPSNPPSLEAPSFLLLSCRRADALATCGQDRQAT